MDNMEKEITMEELVELVNNQSGDFIIQIDLEVSDGK